MITRHLVHFTTAQCMDWVDARSIDLVVTSPPYPMIEMWDEAFRKADPHIGAALDSGDGNRAFQLMHLALDAVWKECGRVLRPGGFLCVNIGDATRKLGDNFRLYTNHSRVTAACESLGFQSLPVILWKKQTNAPNKFMGSGMLPCGAYVTLEHEYVLVFRKGDKRSFSTGARRRRLKSAFFWEERNVWFSDIWDFKGIRQAMDGGEARARSAAYPFELAHRLVSMYSMQGDTVLDPFFGTGTTMVACLAGARNSVGIEVDRSLEPVIEATVAGGADAANRAVQVRLVAHLRFVQEYQSQQGSPLKYTSQCYGFPVMTRQERQIRLYRVQELRRESDGVFVASHTTAHPGDGSAALVEGVDAARTQPQLPF